ncbi:MAG: PDZ domain-containing protein [Gemmatimonadota bacterium]|nr:MAG: PDZ domain-containing protein [Gemmatimonadota bacterium]
MNGRRGLILALVAFFSFLSGGWLIQRGTMRAGTAYEHARLFQDVVAYIAEHSVDTLDEGQLYDLAIDGLLAQLNDPYASFLRPDDVGELRERTTGTYGGLGMQIDARDGWITVIAPMADSPALEAGIEGGDRIVEVEGVSTFGWLSEKAAAELRGEPGTEVQISIQRPGVPEPFELTLTRDTIHIRSVQAAMMLRPEVGFVSLTYSTIGETVVDEVQQAVAELREQGARSLIIDLRNTPGGILEEGIALTDLFLDRGLVVVDTRGRTGVASETYQTRHDQEWPDLSLVVLVNGGTASAAEIFAGALQDHDRAAIVGTPTFGKGLVQTVFPFGPDRALQITTGRWYTPIGRSIQRPIRRVGESLRIVGGLQEELRDMEGDTTVTQVSEVFYTDAGRPVRGGGGIRPDLTVRPDTLSAGEQEFWRSLGAQIPNFRGALTTYALDLKAEEAVTDPDFQVTGVMRAELIRRVRASGVDLPNAVFAAARDVLDTQLEYEITQYIFGREVATRRRTRNDPQIRSALELLDGSPTTQELLTRVAQESGTGTDDPNQ